MTAPPVQWSWPLAVLGAAYALPGALVTAHDPSRGIPLLIGVICAAGLGLRPQRRQRVLAVVAGAIVGVAMLLGSIVGQVPWLAVVTLFVAGVLVAVTAAQFRLGPIVMGLGLPLLAAGLSLSGPSTGLQFGLLMLLGSAYGWLVSLCWPESPVAAPPPAPPAQPAGVALDYGVRLGLTGALSAALALVLGLDHPGWAPTAALMVSRPAPALSRARDLGRAGAVLVGSAAAVLVGGVDPPSWLLGLLCAVAVAAMTATTGSRWYIATGFTTFVVLSLLLVDSPEPGEWWFNQRVAANLIGIGVAYVLMSVVPSVRAARRRVYDGRGRSVAGKGS